MKRLRLLSLLLLPFLAPACAPNEPAPQRKIPRNLVILTDSSDWKPGKLLRYTDSISSAGYRVLVSGYPEENAAALSARLPWLLQPGVDLFIYDDALAGPAGLDSLKNYLERTGHGAKIERIAR
ncbi:hypothetical protein FUA23_02545 [Neolewinella aurantiaca]|uniref:Uncharacterized protein n=1 Tax=Neolewinella aurantiaca TaxID=2602767 RepID=A0A5C7FZG9_9BACT|nr:hypothetical protein [Neolewinella aurantiaca]TXF91126.1 hypothetical protein FUA23_02545 [Neolewinella aurantiaca]